MTQVDRRVEETHATVAGTRPYAWPWDGVITPESLALVVVQAPDSPLGSSPGALAVLADAARRAGITIVEVVTHRPLSEPRGSGWASAAESGATSPLGPDGADYLIHSAGWNGFYESTLDSVLRRAGLTHLLMTGYWLEIGVSSTMRAANDMGYECLLVEDAVASFDPDLTAATLSSTEMSGGIFGAIGTTAAVIDAIAAAPTTAIQKTLENHA